MGEINQKFELYKKTFPSDKFFKKYFGTEEEILQERYDAANALLLQEGPKYLKVERVLRNALESGFIEESDDPSRSEFPYIISREKFYKTNDVYVQIRHIFDSILRITALQVMRSNEWSHPKKAPEIWFVFQDGKLTKKIREYLEFEFEDLLFSPDAEPELCQEFIKWYKAGVFHQDEWWCWKAENDSVWVEVIPEAFIEYKKSKKEKREKAQREWTQSVSL